MRFCIQKFGFCLSLSASAWSCQSEAEKSIDDQSVLRATVWQEWQDSARKAGYQEPLSSELAEKHRHDMKALSGLIPRGYPEPYLPYGLLDNADIDPGLSHEPRMTAELIRLGEALFFDQALSFAHGQGFSAQISCASCHKPELAFSDGESLSIGVAGDETRHNSPGLINVSYQSNLTWSPLFLSILEKQAEIPLFGDDPIEMGLRGLEQDLRSTLVGSPVDYVELFRSAFPEQKHLWLNADFFNYDSLTLALAAYQRSLIEFDSPFDRWLQGDSSVLDTEELVGLQLFFQLQELESGEKLNCNTCHSGFLFSNNFQYVLEGKFYWNQEFHESPHHDDLDFKVPSLRKLRFTKPYGAFGQFADLTELLREYEEGRRHASPSFSLTGAERVALIKFLQAL